MNTKSIPLMLSVLLALCLALTSAVYAEDLFFSTDPFGKEITATETETPTPTPTPTADVSPVPQTATAQPTAVPAVPTARPAGPIVYNFFRLEDDCFTGCGPRPVYLPATGISGKADPKPSSVNYESTAYSIELPSVNASADLMIVPKIDGSYPVTWLGDKAGLLAGSALPGEDGQTWIVGHNHIDNDEYGPFMDLGGLENGDRIFVMDHTDGSRLVYVVYDNIKVAADDLQAVYAAADRYPNTMTLITCEDERSDGGYTNRRVVCARPM